MSLEKLYDYVCGVMQRTDICIDSNDKEKMLQLLPLSVDLRSSISGDQSRAIHRVLKNLDERPKAAQEIELFIMAHRLGKAIEMESWPTCNKCGESVPETVNIAVGTDLYSCCRDCADKVCDYIAKV